LEDAYRGTEVDLELEVPEYASGVSRSRAASLQGAHPEGATDGQRLRLPGKGGKALKTAGATRPVSQHRLASRIGSFA